METNEKLGERAALDSGHEAFMAKLRKHFQINACRVVARPLGQVPVDRASLSYRLLSALEVQELVYDPALRLAASFVRAAQARQDACIAAFDGKQVVAYAWTAFGSGVCKNDVWVKVDPRACYVYKSFVRPEYRDDKVTDALHTVADQFWLWTGKRFCMSFIHDHNPADMEQTRRRGGKTIAHAGYIEPMGINWALRAPGTERLEFHFFKPA